ncbi:nicolin-1 isoform X1 [Fundulus heteroclitus]|uniref:Nicolin 1 n=1 Tax=Fundulus heteroclitus TaxID=8078 RepID=A0A3Q2PEK8_FUNHE|nr:nicolin-1 isoform X1 [Fundulus heteroclitus]XP_012707167.1 nicolin-1 isoform X1 [Fundulus heteroclitus]XP_036007639.1 nicolin-1 isoform X1 [Fundulus heteroclitus]
MSKFSDGRQPISCTVKAPVYLQIGESRAETAQSGVCVVDVALPFGKAVSIEEITFKNYYTAYITVRLLRRTSARDGPTKWCTALRDLLLMDNPHTERGSQDYYSIHRDQMLVEADHVVSVRLILKQPSSAWLAFSLEEIKIFPRMEPEPEKEVSDWLSDLILVDQHPDVEGLPDPQTVSSSIQQMWALTEVMQTNQTTASIGRFDVDGCYDIDLLSLT